jgi:hypothetical protein
MILPDHEPKKPDAFERQDSPLQAAVRKAVADYVRQKAFLGNVGIGAILRNFDLVDSEYMAPLVFRAIDELASQGVVEVVASPAGSVGISWRGAERRETAA